MARVTSDPLGAEPTAITNQGFAFLLGSAMELTQELVKEIFDYDPETGVLTWRYLEVCLPGQTDRTRRTVNTKRAGKPVGEGQKGRYIKVSVPLVKDKICLFWMHRLIFLWYHGHMPLLIDHEDHDSTNNRISNLRNVGPEDNSKNMSKDKRNKSGAAGVHWCEDRKKWVAQIHANGEVTPLGRYETIEAATEVRRAAEKKYGYHKNHGT